MNGVLVQTVTLLLGVALALAAESEERWRVLPRQMVGEFARSEAPFYLYSAPGTLAERRMVPAVRKGTPVRLYHATPDNRWYRIGWYEGGADESYTGWVEGDHLVVWWKGSKADAESPPAPDPAREAAAEREQQRAALDRIRAKTEALRQAEEADRARLRAEAEARWREGEERLRVQTERERAARQAGEAAAREQREQQEAAQRERERQLERFREIEAKQVAQERREWAERVVFDFVVGYSAFFLLPFFALYRIHLEHCLTPFGHGKHPILFGASALGCAGSIWLLSTGRALVYPEALIVLGLCGLFFWYFVPGLLFLGFVLLHSLLVPHPMDAILERMVRGEPVSPAETARVTDAMKNAQRDGIPADWRVKSRLWRLERFAKLMGQEKAFLNLMSEYILHQHRDERRN